MTRIDGADRRPSASARQALRERSLNCGPLLIGSGLPPLRRPSSSPPSNAHSVASFSLPRVAPSRCQGRWHHLYAFQSRCRHSWRPPKRTPSARTNAQPPKAVLASSFLAIYVPLSRAEERPSVAVRGSCRTRQWNRAPARRDSFKGAVQRYDVPLFDSLSLRFSTFFFCR